MKIEATIGPNGIERKIDFEGAMLPDGRSIDKVLGENDLLKEQVNNLKRELGETSSIFVILIPNRKLRTIVEIVSMVATIIGIVQLFIIFF
jgi:hypothetical protein